MSSGVIAAHCPSYVLLDTFQRANSTTVGAGAVGSAMVEVVGDWSILSNKLRTPVGSESYSAWEIGTNTYHYEMTFDAHTSDSGPIFRWSDSNNFMLVSLVYGGTSAIYQRNQGAYIIDGTSASVAWADNDLVGVDVTPTAIVITRNGTSVLTSSSVYLASRTLVGFRSMGAMNVSSVKAWT